jgi:3-hydroxyacyl-CoA dehydrogenase
LRPQRGYAAFGRLRSDAGTRPFRYAFLAERRAATIDGLDRSVRPRELRRAAVVGAGAMGQGIAIALAEAGLEVWLLDQSSQAVDRALAAARATWDRAVERGRLSEPERAALQRRLTASDLDDLSEADIAIEAVVEDLAVQHAVFADLDRVLKPGAILATNTSALDVNAIAAATSRPGDVVGLHFFNPANVMKLLEVVRGDATSDAVLASVMALARAMGKVAVVARVCDGFIGNRMV